ncbi:MAG: TMEM175 family protein [Rhodanobacteraceae bacterium]
MPESTTPAEPETAQERTDSGRLDNFVDGAFAVAITLLVISGASLPKDVAALEQALRGVPAFAACFAELAWFWHGHVRWRDSVGLTDRRSLLLSLLLVFFALIFVFPLHIVFSQAFNSMSDGVLSPGMTSVASGSANGTAILFVSFGLSFACMAGTLAALYAHGIRTVASRARTEFVSARIGRVTWTYVAAVSLLSVLLALSLPSSLSGLAGFCYFLFAATHLVAKRYRKHLEATSPS